MLWRYLYWKSDDVSASMMRRRHLISDTNYHDDVIKWKNFPRYWPFVRGIHRLPVNSPHKGQWHGALMFSLICTWINGWVNNGKAGDLRRHRAHYDVTVMTLTITINTPPTNLQPHENAFGELPICSETQPWLGVLEATGLNKYNKQRVLVHGHQGWNIRHGLCHIYMIYVYIWVVYSFCLFCCLFIIVTTQFVALYKPCKPKPKFR